MSVLSTRSQNVSPLAAFPCGSAWLGQFRHFLFAQAGGWRSIVSTA